MTLLLQAIQEYLKDKHPKWTAAPYKYNENIIDIIDPHRSAPLIALNTDHKTIISVIDNYRTEHTYTDHTLLPQITKTINTLKQQ